MNLRKLEINEKYAKSLEGGEWCTMKELLEVYTADELAYKLLKIVSKVDALNQISQRLKNDLSNSKIGKHFRFCPNCNHTNTKDESLNKYTCCYCSSEEDLNY